MGYSISHMIMLQVWHIYQHLPMEHLGIEKCWGYSLLSRHTQIFSGYPTGSHGGFFYIVLGSKDLAGLLAYPDSSHQLIGMSPYWDVHSQIPEKYHDIREPQKETCSPEPIETGM